MLLKKGGLGRKSMSDEVIQLGAELRGALLRACFKSTATQAGAGPAVLVTFAGQK